MLPLELIRHDPERVKRAAELKGEPAPIDEILELDEEWRAHLHKAETIKAGAEPALEGVREDARRGAEGEASRDGRRPPRPS